MNENLIYMPILKGKAGEFQALRELPVTITKRILPLIEVPPLTVDAITEKETTIDEHIQKAIKGINDSGWLAEDPMLVDTFMLSEELSGDKEVQPLADLINLGRNSDKYLVPVARVTREDSYVSAMREIIQEDSQLCIRVTDKDIELGLELNETLHEFINCVETSPEAVHLLIDFREISEGDVGKLALSFNSLLSIITGTSRWRTVTLGGSSFPVNMTNIDRNSKKRIARAEWKLYQRVSNAVEEMYGMGLMFGDYAVSHPDPPPNIDPRQMQQSANIRYTTEDAWIIYKGESIKKSGSNQLHSLSEQVMLSDEFKGREFSWGDAYIADCATRQVGPGNPTTWRRVGTNHHIAVVVEQLSS